MQKSILQKSWFYTILNLHTYNILNLDFRAKIFPIKITKKMKIFVILA